MTTRPQSPAQFGQPHTDSAEQDSLVRAEVTLNSVDGLQLENHPEAFSTFDELLREALESPPHVSSA